MFNAASSLHFSMYRSIGSRMSSILSAGDDLAPYAPDIIRLASNCTQVNSILVRFVWPRSPNGAYQTEHTNMMMGKMRAW